MGVYRCRGHYGTFAPTSALIRRRNRQRTSPRFDGGHTACARAYITVSAHRRCKRTRRPARSRAAQIPQREHRYVIRRRAGQGIEREKKERDSINHSPLPYALMSSVVLLSASVADNETPILMKRSASLPVSAEIDIMRGLNQKTLIRKHSLWHLARACVRCEYTSRFSAWNALARRSAASICALPVVVR